MTGIDRDILLTRVLDGRASPEDWAAFRAMAARDPEVWADLADAQQDRAELQIALAQATQIADHIDAPVDIVTGERLTARLNRAAAWVGWIAAATLAMTTITAHSVKRTTAVPPPTQQAGLFSVSSPQEALKMYFNKGKEAGTVLGEVPDRVLLQTTPSPDGQGYELVYLRQIVEKTHVNELYQLAIDEAGRRVPVRYKPTFSTPPTPTVPSTPAPQSTIAKTVVIY